MNIFKKKQPSMFSLISGTVSSVEFRQDVNRALTAAKIFRTPEMREMLAVLAAESPIKTSAFNVVGWADKAHDIALIEAGYQLCLTQLVALSVPTANQEEPEMTFQDPTISAE